ncbi:MAG: sulfite exporter TauE/SafE family protein [Alphaproteobacteria bacterium]|nr:sulfite exporter TauE/SafE family protein [Alphaproteobacteria bacterium]
MSLSILIATSFSIGFFFESIIGFGGGLIAYAILSFFMDLKEMILAGLYIGTCSSAYIAYTDFKSFDKKIFKSLIPLALMGTILGVLVFTKFSTKILSPVFGSLLVLLAVKTIFFDRFSFPKIFKKKLIFIGGIVHGAFGSGGPFVVNAIKDDFKTKSALRTTMAVFFTFFNFVRIAQLGIQNQLEPDFFSGILWTIFPVFIAIKLGHKVHVKLNEDLFKKGVALMTIFAGLKFLAS